MAFSIVNIYAGTNSSNVSVVVFQIRSSKDWRPITDVINITASDIIKNEIPFHALFESSPGNRAVTGTFMSNLEVGSQLKTWDLKYPGHPTSETVEILTTDGGDGSDARSLQDAFKLLRSLNKRNGWKVKLPKQQPIFRRK